MRQSAESYKASPFLAPTAVEAWDTWFRWRRDGELRDDTIEATWQRVGTAVARAESTEERTRFEHRLLDAFGSWRLLLDQRLLATAGTETMSWPDDGLVAVLNLARFVAAGNPPATVDFAAVQDCASLAVRALDNAIALRGVTGLRQAKTLRIGVIGLADALASLGFDYDSAEARGFARSSARALAEGCLGEALALAAARGSGMPCDAACAEKLHLRGVPADLVDLARRHGLRYHRLTSITAQPKLAKFANDVSDAVAPLHVAGPGKALATTVPAQLELRGAMQPWVDEPIACPICVNGRPSPASHIDWYARAVALGLGALHWQF